MNRHASPDWQGPRTLTSSTAICCAASLSSADASTNWWFSSLHGAGRRQYRQMTRTVGCRAGRTLGTGQGAAWSAFQPHICLPPAPPTRKSRPTPCPWAQCWNLCANPPLCPPAPAAPTPAVLPPYRTRPPTHLPAHPPEGHLQVLAGAALHRLHQQLHQVVTHHQAHANAALEEKVMKEWQCLRECLRACVCAGACPGVFPAGARGCGGSSTAATSSGGARGMGAL